MFFLTLTLLTWSERSMKTLIKANPRTTCLSPLKAFLTNLNYALSLKTTMRLKLILRDLKAFFMTSSSMNWLTFIKYLEYFFDKETCRRLGRTRSTLPRNTDDDRWILWVGNSAHTSAIILSNEFLIMMVAQNSCILWDIGWGTHSLAMAYLKPLNYLWSFRASSF